MFKGREKVQRIVLTGALSLGALVLVATLWLEKYYLYLSFFLVILSLIPFYLRFERKKMKAEEILLIAVLAAIAALSRVPFASLPSVQPTSFVVISSGLIFGPQAGFMVGSTSALVSNFFLGQGPWTPWQMFGWGMMGFSAGLLRIHRWMNNRIGLGVFGFLWGFLFGWIMNLWFILGFFENIRWEVFASVYLASFYFDFSHGLSNVVIILLFSSQWQKILERIKLKYGLLK